MGKYSKRKLHFSNNYFINEKEDLVISELEVNKITFLPSEYENTDMMWKEIADLQRTLLRNNQIVRVRKEEDLVVMEFVHDNNIEWYGGTSLEFVTEDELEMINGLRQEDCDTLNSLLKSVENEECEETND